MKRVAVLLVTAVAALCAAGLAAAHPLGNFTTNQYAEVVLSGDRAYVTYVLDLAEIPTFQSRDEARALGADGYEARLAGTAASGLTLAVDGRTRTLTPLDRRLSFLPGAAGLRTTRFELVLDAGRLARGAAHTVQVRNDVFADRLGWRELVVRGERGAILSASSVASGGVSDRLRAYPRTRLTSPLDVRAAEARVVPGEGDGVAPSLVAAPEPGAHAGSGFARLVEERDLTVGVVLVSLLVALFWGAAHALGPGHGKAVVTAYLVGTRGRPRDALLLGGIVTVTHTIGVFTLGLVTLALSALIVPEQLYPWLTLVSAVLVVLVGAGVLRQRVRIALAPAPVQAHDHDHGPHHHHHDHHHVAMTDEEHARAHLPQEGSGLRGLLAVGISGGLIPCPTALVVLLAAISLHRVAFGLLLIAAFSLGLAAVVSAIGLVAIAARERFGRMRLDGGVIRALPTVSALVILAVGVAMTARALPAVT